MGKLRAAAQAPVSPSIYRKLRARIAFLEDPREFVDGFNRAFVARRLEQDAEWFDSVQPNPLTREQRLGIVRDEDTNLLVAGAGAGKTSTMVGKVAYLLRHGLARPSEILVLAFAEKAEEELTERLSTTLADPVPATTFHAFGLGLIARVEDKKLSLSALAQDKRALSKFIADRVGRLLSDRERRGDVVRFFTDLLHEGDPAEEAKTPDEFYRRQRDIGLNAMRFEGADAALRTLSDVRVKSLQEVKIGNWLTLEGIDWEYERKYEHPTADREHRQYEPDFYLPKYKIYLEHFGVGRDGRTAPGVDAQKYRASMRWKRELHQRFETTLVESYSYDFTEGKFPGRLYRQLKRRGVERRLLTEQEIAALVHARNKGFSPLVKLLNTFLSLFKGARLNMAQAEARSTGQRDLTFLRIFKSIHTDYERRLRDDEDIDFNDMISRARGYIENGTYESPYRYILVDEFQDISANRLGFIQSLRAHVARGRIFGVGDDWQSIYRFAGSDVRLFTHLSDSVGATCRTDLGTTFRFRQELADFSSKFVMRNPAQLKKRIKARAGDAGYKPIRVLCHDRGWPAVEQALFDALGDAAARWDRPGKARVLLLGRYNLARSGDPNSGRLTPDRVAKLANRPQAARLDIGFLTIHGSKGLESDFVVLLGNEAGGFPSEIADDPVLKMVLSAEDDCLHAEERRLFYVAVTRARRRAYLLVPSNRPSSFIQELLEPAYAAYVDNDGTLSTRHICPMCCGRTVRQEDGPYGVWWACSNWDDCLGRLTGCPSCSDGHLAPVDTSPGAGFACISCKARFRRCPKPECLTGALVPRTGKFGPFLGCTEYRSNGEGCGYTYNG